MLQVKNITFTHIENPVIENVSFEISKGQHIAIIGESGCGKSTLLKLLYGIYNLDNGEITYDNKQILGPKYNLIPGEDYIKYLAQDFDLMPYITVEENVGKFLSNVYKTEKKARVHELLEMVEMTEFAKVKAKYLSGGQQQRVALARVLALEPEILLLDEPFSQVDSFRKNSLRRNLFNYFKKKQITCIIATHDSAETLSFSDQIIVLKNGKLIAKGNSRELYENPSTYYIASLFGEVNELKKSNFSDLCSEDETILLFPHQLKVIQRGKFRVIVKQCYFKGSHYLIKAAYERKAIFFDHNSELDLNQEVCLDII
jgi:ABC-type Fe3+/spermidine/putrescine transport system ATPase subunit